MQINLKGNIVILDEAHNIEDFCREAGSVNLKDSDLKNAADDCELLSKKRPEYCKTYLTIQEYLTDVVKFLQNINVKDNVSMCVRQCNYRVINYVSILRLY